MNAETQHMHLMQWLNPFLFDTYHREACEQHFEGSGNWLLSDERFQRWLTPNQNFLWLHVSAGCGKTVLSSSIIKTVERSHLLLHFYMTFHQRDTLSIHTLLRTLIWQLSRKHSAVRPLLEALHSKCNGGSSDKTTRLPTTKELQMAFSKMLRLVPRVWIVIDALDELVLEGPKQDSENVINWITNLVDLETGHVHLAVTSRDEQEIRTGFETMTADNNSIAINGEGLDQDIEAYVRSKVANLKRWKNAPTIRREMQTKLFKRADGM
jgi:hypothetical protein